jgi:hypothetical protein
MSFIRDVAMLSGSEPGKALETEKKYQKEVFGGFSDLRGARVRLKIPVGGPEYPLVKEIFDAIGIIESHDGTVLPVPYPFPVGTGGMKRMLHLWRRALVCRAV